MATNKKSFVAYCDWLESFEELTNEEAGKLVKHLFKYVNDLEPESPDRLTKMCFIPIKQSLKRDLKKYDTYINKQSENGKKGGRPKKLTDKKETQKTQPFILKPKKADSVSDSVSDSVNDNVSVINKEKKLKKENLVFPFDTISFKKLINIWFNYRYEEHRFKYKSLTSKQAFLKQIGQDYKSEEEVAEAMQYSMGNGYKGLIKPPLNKNQNGTSNNDNTKGKTRYSDNYKTKIFKELQSS
jgi:hypothetical protein